MQSTPPPSMYPLPPWPSSRFGVYCSVLGLSAVTIYGAWKFAAHFKDVQRCRMVDRETRRQQEEELVLLRHTLNQREAEIAKKQTAVLSKLQEIEELQTRVFETGLDLENSRQQNGKLTDRMKSVNARNQQLEAEANRLKEEHLQAVDLLGIRTAELKGAQAFLTKADQLSGADVIKLVVELNSEIMQTAAIVAEDLVIQQKKMTTEGKVSDSEEMKEAYGRTEEIVGPRMAELLRTSEHHEDPILVQIALQASMSAYTHWIVSSWCFESPEDEHMLSEIYARVRESEEQAVSGRWRQLTRTHLQRMLIQEPEFTSDMADAFSSILITAGLQENLLAVHDRIVSNYSSHISKVMTLAQRLNKQIGEGVTSCDLEALYIAPDVAFDATSMEDAISTTSVRKTDNGGQETILCTTDLGLVRAEKVSGTLGDWHESILLRPKVVLYSGIVGGNGSVE